MLKIDCLLVNTEVAQTVRKIIGYLGHKGIAEGKDVSFRNMYNELRKNGVEIDLETAAHIYADELPIRDARFTSMEDLKYDSGRWFDDIVRGITLQKPRRGEKQIGELSPAQAAVKAISNAFHSNVVEDHTTKSILKTLQDVYTSAAKRMLGELPNEKNTKETRSAEEIVQAALDKEAMGYRDIGDGTIKGLAKMHDEVRKEIAELTREMEMAGDHDKAEEWKNYAKSLEDATYTMLFTQKEAKKILHDAMKDGGFTKKTKEGKDLIDWQKLAGHVNSYEQLRDNVVKSLTDTGIDPDTAGRVADSMSKEFRDIRGKILQTAERTQEKITDTWSAGAAKDKKELTDTIDKRVQDWKNITKFEGKEDAPLKFTLHEAQKIIGDTLKTSDAYGMDIGVEGRAIDWQKLASAKPDVATLRDMITDRLVEQGIRDADAQQVSAALARDYHSILTDRIQENSQRLLDQRTAQLDREAPASKGALTRLAELHDLGVFQGSHDRLLSHVLGIEEHDTQAMEDVRQYAEQMSKLRALMQGNDFLVPSMQRKIAHHIQQIIARNVENKTRLLKIMSNFNKVFQIENSSLVSGYRNLLENHLSGLIEYATTKANLRLKLGKDLTGNKQALRELMGDTWQTIAKGGEEFGLAPYQVGGTQLRMTDVYNLNQMKGADWSKPKTWMKGVISGVMTVPRAFLLGTDGLFKTGNYRLHFLNGMHDALVQSGQYTSKEAVAFINDAIYGPGQLEKARIKAKQLYENTGIPYISQKEINITANELLHENLLQGFEVTPEMIEEVQKSAFKMAGLGMGHESNNPFSRVIQSSKLWFNRQETEAFAKGNYSQAARMRMWNTLVNSVALRFAASQANWAWIKVEQSGVGIISGLVHYRMGKAMRPQELMTLEGTLKQAEHFQKARQSAARGMLGMAANAALVTVVLPAIAQAMHPDEEDPVQKMFEDMESNFLAKAIFLKTTPIWGLADYFSHTTKSASPTFSTVNQVVSNVTGFGTNTSSALQFAEASKLIASKNPATVKKGQIKLAKLFSSYLPHVPWFKPAQDVLSTVDYFRTGKQPLYNYPTNVMQGLFGGGAIEGVISSMPKNMQPDWAEGWGEEEAAAPVKKRNPF